MIQYLIAKFIKKIKPYAIKNSKIHNSSKICSGSELYKSSVGRNSYVGYNSKIIHADIGSFCSIADNVIIGGASHPIKWLSTSPIFHSGKNILRKNISNIEYNPYKFTQIKHDVWIGNNVLIKAGVKIDVGAIIGMGSVVTKDVGAYEIWAGVPAKCIKKRFSDELIIDICNSQWWELEDEELKVIGFFDDVNKFLLERKIKKK